MAYTPITTSDPISPIENLINPRFVQAYTDFAAADTAITATRAIRTYKWANAAARTAQAGMTEGDVGDQADTEQQWRYSGSAWVNVTTGLFPVIPTSVAGTGVTLGASGKVSFSASSSISVNGCFTAAYENYVVIFDSTRSANGGDISFRLRLAGTDNSGATSYVTPRNFINASVNTPATVTFSLWPADAGVTLNTRSRGRMEIFGPALAAITQHTVHSINSGGFTFIGGGTHDQTVAYDGLTAIIAAGNSTGSLRVYGYNNL